MLIRKGDKVYIRTGKDRGKTGKVIGVDAKSGTVLVEGVNVYKKHSKPKRQGEKGEIVNVVRPMDVSKVMLYCANCEKGVRTGMRTEGEDRKARYCKRCQSSL